VYDMYPWDDAAEGTRSRTPAPRKPRENNAAVLAAAAVQEALDRRDNGGDATEQ